VPGQIVETRGNDHDDGSSIRNIHLAETAPIRFIL